MKLDSDYFSKIRMRRRRPAPPVAKRVCEMSGCDEPGEHRAPKGRQAEGEYFWFCLEHVRSYNKTYNYFNGMNDDDLVAYQKAATIGHRPTWRMGVNASGGDAPPPAGRAKFGWGSGARDPFQVFGDSFQTRRPEPESQRKVHNMETRSLKTLGLDEHCHARRDQGALQAPGQAPPPRRQWRRPVAGGTAARNHPGLQLSEERRFLLSAIPSCPLRSSKPPLPGLPRTPDI